MILVHDKLYRSPDLHRINLGDCLRGLTEQLHRSYRETAERIRLRVEFDEVYASAEVALPCGMIVTELVTNACEYVFPVGAQHAGSFGLQLIHNLAAQPGATLTHTRAAGTEIIIEAPLAAEPSLHPVSS